VSIFRETAGPAPRLPLRGGIDLTYRCNLNCRHCWLVEPDTDETRGSELSTREWLDIIGQARAQGAREWAISGGEPMLREDFCDLFDAVTSKSAFYSLNTNGTLITAPIARKLRKPGDVMVAVYGADPQVHDHVTRCPGSFEKTMQGIAYLREAGARFTVQLLPVNDNFRQWTEMNLLARRLSPHVRIGASWLNLSASGDKAKNDEIRAQRLTPAQAAGLDPPNVPYEERHPEDDVCGPGGGGAYRHCILERDSFHIDSRGGLSFCNLVKDERFRYDLKNGSFAEGWERFLPSMAETGRNPALSDPRCAVCGDRENCRICPALIHLEKKSAAPSIEYLCRLEREKQKTRRLWKAHHRRYFQIAGITVSFNSEQSIRDDTFGPCFDGFSADRPGDDVIQLEHFFSLPDWNEKNLGKLVYEREPWLIYEKEGAFSYVGFVEDDSRKRFEKIAVFASDYSHARIFNRSNLTFKNGNLHSLSMFPSDQIWLSQALALRRAFYLHSCGLVVDGHGMVFVGHSEAGKSTTAKLFGDQAELLCDDRNILRQWPGQGWRVHGTWSHGEIARVSAASAPLKGIFFLEQAPENTLTRIENVHEIRQRLFPCLVRPYVNPEWWEKILPLVFDIAGTIPAYVMKFDKSGAIVPMIRGLRSETGSTQRVHERTGV
jgi:MoaA/NifB/PqqE/SkfB family radical SAM enzyme